MNNRPIWIKSLPNESIGNKEGRYEISPGSFHLNRLKSGKEDRAYLIIKVPKPTSRGSYSGAELELMDCSMIFFSTTFFLSKKMFRCVLAYRWVFHIVYSSNAHVFIPRIFI